MNNNIQTVAEAALSKIDYLIPSWLSDARLEGGDYVALNPTRADKNAGSFRITRNNGKWHETATGEGGGDLVSLFAYLNGGMKQGEAAHELAPQIGLDGLYSNDGKEHDNLAFLNLEAIEANQKRKEKAEQEKADAQKKAANTATQIWESATAASEHDYLKTKGVQPHGLKVCTAHTSNIQQGALIVPLYKNGQLVTVQGIDADGGKQLLKGGEAKGACFVIDGATPAIVCEGYATAASVHEITGRKVYVAISAGNIKEVVKACPDIDLVAADNDQSNVGENAAKATGLAYAMPPEAGDWNDYAQKHGLEAARAAFERCYTKTPEHPLTIPIELGGEPEPPNWVIPQFIAEGIVIIAGGHGVGKTTAILPLACTVAGVCSADNEVKPDHWRHVVYITEDTPQAQRIIAGYQQSIGHDVKAEIVERVHIVEAQRMAANEVVLAGRPLKEKYTRTITTTGLDGRTYTTELLPLVVIDTMAATIELENENDNAEASKAIAAFKQRFEGLPVWIIGHVSKANLDRKNAASGSPTFRGATAFEADANQTLYLVKEADESRWLVRGKTRFEATWPELEIVSSYTTTAAKNRFGACESLTLRWSIAQPPTQSRKATAEERSRSQKEQDQRDLEDRIYYAVARHCEDGQPLNRAALKSIISGNSAAITAATDKLLNDSRLYEVEIPKAERVNKNKKTFLIHLTESEKNELLATGNLPAEKMKIPPYLRKPENGTAWNGIAENPLEETPFDGVPVMAFP